MWGALLHSHISTWVFTQSNKDARLCFLRCSSKYVFLTIVVHDIAIESNSYPKKSEIKAKLTAKFQVKLLGPFEIPEDGKSNKQHLFYTPINKTTLTIYSQH